MTDHVTTRLRPETIHALLGEGFFDVVGAGRFPEHAPALPQPALGRAGRPRRPRPTPSGSATSGASSRCPTTCASRWRSATTATSSACTTPSSATAAASFSRSCATDDGRLLDLGTKGSGQTPWSRGGDGRLTLKGGVREVLATEMLEALGVSTSQDLQPLRDRRGADPQRRAVADALLRAGPPQPLAHPLRHLPAPRRLGDTAALRRLLDHSIAHYLPDSAADRRPGRRLLRRRGRALADPRRRVDGRRLRARRPQHRQHEDHRRELRLRPVALPAASIRLHRRLLRPPASTPSAASPRRCAGTSPASANA